MPALDLEPSSPNADAEAEAPSPQVSRVLYEQFAKMENVLRDSSQLAAEQQKDLILGPFREALEKGEGETGDYVLDDQNLLFHAPRGKLHVVTLQRKLIPGVLALAHGTFGHPGRARTTLIIADKNHGPSLKQVLHEKTALEHAAVHAASTFSAPVGSS